MTSTPTSGPARGRPSDAAQSCFAACAPGLEPLVADELRALGIAGAPEAGGVAFEGTAEQMRAANLWLRTASRVTVTAAEFRARTFFELERHARRIPWERWVAPGATVRFRVTSRKSKLYHQGAVAQRLGEAVLRAVPDAVLVEAAGEDEESGPGQLFVVRFLHDGCVVRADTSGALLHARGYRLALARAPLRETLAAAVLLGSGWRGDTPLADPMCGSGTVPIEAALIARRIAPGLARADRQPRHFAFQEWPGADQAGWERQVAEARARILPGAPVAIQGSDRDAGAVEAARSNAERAGVSVAFEQRALSALQLPDGPGLIAINPPYGVRVGESDALRDLYAALGRTAAARAPGWRLSLLSADRRLEAQVRVRFTEALSTQNGGIPVRLVVAEIPG